MFIDSRLEFSDKQVTTGNNTASTHAIDTQNRAIGPGHPMFVVVQLAADAASNVTVSVQSAASDTFGGAATIGTVLIPANARAGTRFVLGFPYSNARFIRLHYSAAGTFSAWLTGDPPRGLAGVSGSGLARQ